MEDYKGGYRVKTMAFYPVVHNISMALSVFVKIVTFDKYIQKRVVTTMWWKLLFKVNVL